MAANARCRGRLVVHADFTTAACTEELDGRPCAGTDAEHSGGPLTCEEALGRNACEMCALERLSPRDWRHVAHLARFCRTARRCEVHLRARHSEVERAGEDVTFEALAEFLAAEMHHGVSHRR